MATSKTKTEAALKAGSKRFQPYPGLNYYKADAESSAFFAGRTTEVRQCAVAIIDASVLILHGPTGCGKSSFLRAGVKPRIADQDHGVDFTGRPEDFEVIRSMDRPLYQVGQEIRRLVARAESSDQGMRVVDAKKIASLRKAIDDPERGARIGTNAKNTADALRFLNSALANSLILVIDQAEEVFTFNNHPGLGQESSAAENANTLDRERRQEEIGQYFEFLYMMASEAQGVRLVVSLRTEYKGQFDDRIRRGSGKVERAMPSGLSGFYLDRLEEDALVEAIERPTLDAKEWEKLRRKGEVRSARPPVPDHAIAFRFAPDRRGPDGAVILDDQGKVRFPGTARRLARRLLKPGSVPPGGILPALQVACVRLYAQACDALGPEGGEFVVQAMHIDRLGSIQNQVDEYLSETIEKACERAYREIGRPRGLDVTDLIDATHRALASLLVRSELDGRAVTEQRPDDEFRKELETWFSGRLESRQHATRTVSILIEEMEEAQLLRLEGEASPTRTLGHDSLALALQKWRLTYGRDDGMMMRMSMNMRNQPKDWDLGSLFPKGEEPAPISVFVARDFFWDRQLPVYAAENGFADRLGIHFDYSDPTLSPIPDAEETPAAKKSRPTTWDKLVANLRDRDKKLADDAESQGFANGARAMVAAEWSSFPLIWRDEGTNTPKFKDEVAAYANRWTDVLSTNMNLAVGLVGPELEGMPDLAEADRRQDPEAYVRAIRGALLVLAEQGDSLKIIVPGLGARLFVKFAVDLVFQKNSDEYRRLTKLFNVKSRVYTDLGGDQANERYGDVDPLLKHLLESRQHVGEGDDSSAQTTCVVAGAFTRSMGAQSGFQVYFGAKHLVTVARYLMERRAAARKSIKSQTDHGDGAAAEYGDAVGDIAQRVQECLSHTLWQLSIPPGASAFGRERAMVLRLASIGYFTTEHVRTNADHFVSFIQRFVNTTMANATPGPQGVRGARLARSAVRQAIRECFHFPRFDEFAEEVYDLDSVFGYWSDHAVFGSRSMAGAIHQELVALRQRTLAHFDSVTGSIAWLRYNDWYDPKDKEVADAFRDKELAWRHFRIHNFYDAERFMARAAQGLLGWIERVGEKKKQSKSER